MQYVRFMPKLSVSINLNDEKPYVGRRRCIFTAGGEDSKVRKKLFNHIHISKEQRQISDLYKSFFEEALTVVIV